MNKIEIWSEDFNFDTHTIIGWDIMPREGEYVKVKNVTKRIEQVIYDTDSMITRLIVS